MNMTRDEWNEYSRLMSADDIEAVRYFLKRLEEKKGEKNVSTSILPGIGCADGCTDHGHNMDDRNRDRTQA